MNTGTGTLNTGQVSYCIHSEQAATQQERSLNYTIRTALMFMVVLYSWCCCVFKDQCQCFNNKQKSVSSTKAVVGVQKCVRSH